MFSLKNNNDFGGSQRNSSTFYMRSQLKLQSPSYCTLKYEYSHLIFADAQKKPNLLLEFWVLFIAPSSMKRLRFSTLKKKWRFFTKEEKCIFFFIKRCFNKYYRDNIKYYHRRRASFLVFLYSFFITLNSITKRRRSIDGLGITWLSSTLKLCEEKLFCGVFSMR